MTHGAAHKGEFNVNKCCVHQQQAAGLYLRVLRNLAATPLQAFPTNAVTIEVEQIHHFIGILTEMKKRDRMNGKAEVEVCTGPAKTQFSLTKL